MDTFTGVVTTGIYCRPGCPATPLRRNTLPFGHAAAAEAAGFRPCLRCRPDRVPDPGWIAAPELVCRAMHCIADGALDDATEDELADAPRRERAPPAPPVRRARRRDAERGRPLAPRPLRPPPARRHRSPDDADRDRGRLQQRAPDEPGRCRRSSSSRRASCAPSGASPIGSSSTAGSSCASRTARRSRGTRCSTFLAPRAIPGVEAVDLDAGVYRRVVELDGAPGVIEVWDVPREQALRLRVHLPAIDGLVHLVAGVRRLFDLDADPKVIDRHLARDDRARARSCAPARGSASPARSIRSSSACARSSASRSRSAARPRSRARSSSSSARPCRGIAPLGLTHLFPTRATVAHADLSTLGLTARPGPRAPRLRGRDGERRARARPRHRPRRDGPGAVRAARDRAVDRATTSRCARAASATRSRRPISRCRKALGADPGRRRRGVATVAGLRRDAPLGRARSLSTSRSRKCDHGASQGPWSTLTVSLPPPKRLPWSAPVFQLEIVALDRLRSRTGSCRARSIPAPLPASSPPLGEHRIPAGRSDRRLDLGSPIRPIRDTEPIPRARSRPTATP